MWISLHPAVAVLVAAILVVIYILPRFVWPISLWEKAGISLSDPHIAVRRVLGLTVQCFVMPFVLLLFTSSLKEHPAGLFPSFAGTNGPSLAAWLGLSLPGSFITGILRQTVACIAACLLSLILVSGFLLALALEAALDTPTAPDSSKLTVSRALTAVREWASSPNRSFNRTSLLSYVGGVLYQAFNPSLTARACLSVLPGLRREVNEELPLLLKGGKVPVEPWRAPYEGEGEKELKNCRSVIAAIQEEVLLRAIPLALLRASGFSRLSSSLIAAFLFGIAHIPAHLAAPLPPGRPAPSLATALLRSAPQMLYTTIFGAAAGGILLATASLPATAAAHALCNTLATILPAPGFWDDASPAFPLRKQLWGACVAGPMLFAALLVLLPTCAVMDGM